ncbi:MAG: DUF4249 domain-containing protein [Flavisolibacter sp.]|nr:DUF4249 domain-containing protein [Flavisolibacter sp.]
MRGGIRYFFFCCLWFTSLLSCRRPYEPPEVKADNRFLVVDGVINSTPDAATTITLSRTRRLVDTITSSAELRATLFLESSSGVIYPFIEKGKGVYTLDRLNLNANEKYRLKINTANGKQYASEYVPVKQTPPIDSLSWEEQPDHVTIYAYTHDPQNNTRYYRWEYEETWEYYSYYDADMGVSNGMIFYRDSTNQVHVCWQNGYSTNIVVGSSIKLSEDVINRMPVGRVFENTEKINYKYSMLVKQYALTEEAYNYWDILQKNTQQVGSLFDAQPSQLKGNIHSLNDPSEPVIGFVSISSVQNKRIFIRKEELADWNGASIAYSCDLRFIAQNPSNYLLFNYPDTSFGPYYFVSGGGIAITRKSCMDCTYRGGTNVKPAFWR